jgi:large subunit ribosomal protein L17
MEVFIMLKRKLGRESAHRTALFRSLVTALFDHGRIETTEIKAKEAKALAEKMITLAKKGDLHSRRLAAEVITEPEVLQKLFNTIAGNYTERKGGYTRIVKIGPRRGDAAPMVILELV